MSGLAHKILIIGVGNTLRGDDGAGAFVCEEYARLYPGTADTVAVQQLHTGLLDEIVRYDHVVIVDASVGGQPVAFGPLREQLSPVSSSHAVNAGLLYSLARQLYGRRPVFMICGVKGENFEIGRQISLIAQARASRAVEAIRDWVQSLPV